VTYSEVENPQSAIENLTILVQDVMRVEETTLGLPKQNFRVRYRGALLLDAERAYDQLAGSLRPLKITPLFRIEEGRHTIILLDGIFEPKPSNPWINLILFALTVGSVLLAGTLYGYTGPDSDNLPEMFLLLLSNLWLGWPFALSLLAILLAHEFGHYTAGRLHRAAVTLPYFIPFPLSIFGTLGAFIQLKEPPKNRNVLLDIGAAGPYAGLIVAIPVLIVGLLTSEVHSLPATMAAGQSFEGNSVFYLLLKFAIFGEWLPRPEHFQGLHPLLYWGRYFFTGSPLPVGGLDVTLNQVAWAGWAGLLVTMLNLIPVGQLDGGHLLYVLVGRRAKYAMPVAVVVLIALGFVWSGWFIWAALIFFVGRHHAEPLDQITPLTPWRKAAAIGGLVLFVLLFMPVPLVTVW